MKTILTRIDISKDDRDLSVYWEETDMGFDGICSLWRKGEKLCEHKISISRGRPIGNLFVTLDNVGYGCWAMVSFKADTLTERDLQWATAWAVQAIERKHISIACEPFNHEVIDSPKVEVKKQLDKLGEVK